MRIRSIITPFHEKRLVAREAVEALAGLGCAVAAKNESFFTGPGIARLFALPPGRSGLAEHPDLFFTVNFHGLDRDGEVFAAFERNGVPVAVWLVDNPWNQLSGLRSDFWKKAFLFVTDDSFIPGLRDAGAAFAYHMPLAAGQHGEGAGCAGKDIPAGQLAPLVFVGRSAFPDKERFFVGQSLDTALYEKALARMRAGARPGFFWWLDALGLEGELLWPGSAARKASFGAEETSAAWRAACLGEAAKEGLTLFGDDGWRDIVPRTSEGGKGVSDLRPPVDYYGALPGIYRAAEFSLNMTSFLLPHGLTQRHFDVWAAGGFLLTDPTPGLGIFPDELVAPVCFARPEEIPARVSYFRKHPGEKKTLSGAWKREIAERHGYPVRMAGLFDFLGATVH